MARPPRRDAPAGLIAGARLTRIDGPADALALVAPELAEAEDILHELVASDVAEVPAIARYLVDAGGKRLRPALTALARVALGIEEPMVRLMCTGELLHLGSLLHDDVVDEGDLRRGKPTAHRLYGAPVAVLTGDFCLARSILLAAEEGGFRAVTELGRTVTRMAEGEVLQLKRAHDLATDVDGYLDVVDRKSAALIAWCAAAPAWATGDDEAAEALAVFGRGVGRAFQLTDDVLDFQGGTGKRGGADLRERKVTLPLIFAMERDRTLRNRLEQGAPAEEELPLLVERVRATGALDRTLAVARGYVSEALGALDALPSGVGRDALAVLGRYLVERSL
ncbi:MAG: polyprenyl synthetase family protein [Alphaproteobacteria bacterium]|nr:polyprenyl synthetase family protein [Alphaproteobacteria bacterium]